MNNDRLKFRVWDKEKEEYVRGYWINQNGLICEESCDTVHCECADTPENENLIVELCTGLKDKNGKLIYENDKLSFDGDNAELIGSYVVNWQNGGWFLGEALLSWLHYGNKDILEVVGNSHNIS